MFENLHNIKFQKNKAIIEYSIQESSQALVMFKGHLRKCPPVPVNLLSAS